MNVGILGTGFGAYHLELYSKMSEVDKIYIFGRNTEKLSSLKDQYSVFTTSNINALLDDDTIDLIDICLPSSLHYEYAMKALQKGKHVFCETPVTLNPIEAKALINAKKLYNKQCMVDLFTRFEYSFNYLYELCRSNQFGALKHLKIERETPPIWGDLGADKITTDLMIHDIDIVSWLFGPTKNIHSCFTNGRKGQCMVSSLFQFDTAYAEVIASSMMPYSHPFRVSFEAVYESAAIRYYEDSYKDSVNRELSLYVDNKKEILNIPEINCYEKAIKTVISSILNETTPINDITAAAQSLQTAFDIRDQICK